MKQQLSEGGVRDTLSYGQLTQMQITVPTMDEQERIGALFTGIDRTITGYQQSLARLRDKKKALLQQLFI